MTLRAWSKWAVGLLPASVAAVAWAAPGTNAPPVSADPSASAAVAAPPVSGPISAPNVAPAKLDPKGKTGMSPQMVKLRQGHAAYSTHDFAAAIAAYQEAIASAPSEPSGYYFLGEAELGAGQPADAEAALQKGLKSAPASDEWHAKLLFALADLRERQSRFVDARKTWQELAQFADAHEPTKAAAASALQRIQRIDAHLELETRSAAVKQRIEQRQRETGTAPLSADPQGSAPKP